MGPFFKIIKRSQKSNARVGKIYTEHGTVDTPVFMPVATQGTVKTQFVRDLYENDVQMLCLNAYHLYLRPGMDIIGKAGGIHKFMNFDKPILSDSGGFQVFSLADLREISRDGVTFRSHIDGSSHEFTPEKVMDIEKGLGVDIKTCFDECISWPAPYNTAKVSVERTTEWAKRCKNTVNSQQLTVNSNQPLFGIVQGSTYLDLRKQSAEQLIDIEFDGYAIGGICCGEPKELSLEVVSNLCSILPDDKPRYLMGVGLPEDLLEYTKLGIDMFDCVTPTRDGRTGTLFTEKGKFAIKNSIYKDDFRPIDNSCSCYACKNYSRAYIRHLFNAGEMLGPALGTLHNIHFFIKKMQEIRKGIIENLI